MHAKECSLLQINVLPQYVLYYHTHERSAIAMYDFLELQSHGRFEMIFAFSMAALHFDQSTNSRLSSLLPCCLVLDGGVLVGYIVEILVQELLWVVRQGFFAKIWGKTVSRSVIGTIFGTTEAALLLSMQTLSYIKRLHVDAGDSIWIQAKKVLIHGRLSVVCEQLHFFLSIDAPLPRSASACRVAPWTRSGSVRAAAAQGSDCLCNVPSWF